MAKKSRRQRKKDKYLGKKAPKPAAVSALRQLNQKLNPESDTKTHEVVVDVDTKIITKNVYYILGLAALFGVTFAVLYVVDSQISYTQTVVDWITNAL